MDSYKIVFPLFFKKFIRVCLGVRNFVIIISRVNTQKYVKECTHSKLKKNIQIVNYSVTSKED